jgi:hypothetical protein
MRKNITLNYILFLSIGFLLSAILALFIAVGDIFNIEIGSRIFIAIVITIILSQFFAYKLNIKPC